MSVIPTPPPDQVRASLRPAAVAGSAAAPSLRRWRWALSALTLVAMGAAGCAGTTSSDEADGSAGSVAVVDSQASDTTAAPETTAAAETTAPAAPETTAAPVTVPAQVGDTVEGAPTGARGTRTAPVPVGEIADVGDGWRLQVLNVVEDGTAAVLTENQFNDPPAPGSRFTLVEVAVGYFGTDDPTTDLFLTVSGVATANRELDRECGVLPNALPVFLDYFAGGVAVGNICFVTEPGDAGALQLYASTGFGGDDVFLAATTPAAPVMPMAGLPGPREGATATPLRLDAAPLGTAVDIGEGWSVAVTGPAFDITDATLAENQFNSPPPDGFRFVAVPVAYAFNGSGTGSGFDVTMQAVADSNVRLDSDCGVIPSAIDVFADVFSGGMLTGNLCFVVPAEAVGSLVLYGSAGFSGEAVYLKAS